MYAVHSYEVSMRWGMGDKKDPQILSNLWSPNLHGFDPSSKKDPCNELCTGYS